MKSCAGLTMPVLHPYCFACPHGGASAEPLRPSPAARTVTALPPCRYDAVTTGGHRQWQDTVNDLNRPFFGVADGIFVNYAWKARTPSQAAVAAGARCRDVYMGIVSACPAAGWVQVDKAGCVVPCPCQMAAGET